MSGSGSVDLAAQMVDSRPKFTQCRGRGCVREPRPRRCDERHCLGPSARSSRRAAGQAPPGPGIGLAPPPCPHHALQRNVRCNAYFVTNVVKRPVKTDRRDRCLADSFWPGRRAGDWVSASHRRPPPPARGALPREVAGPWPGSRAGRVRWISLPSFHPATRQLPTSVSGPVTSRSTRPEPCSRPRTGSPPH